MVTQLRALSISHSVQTGPIFEIGPVWHVLAVFGRACDLATQDGDVVALVLPEIGDGPLNLVVQGQAGIFAAIKPGTRASTGTTAVRLGDLEIRLDEAALWEPRPGWDRLRRNRAQIVSHLAHLQALALRQASKDSLLALSSTESDLTGFPKPVRSGTATTIQAARQLKAGWAGDPGALQTGAAQLAGLGSGLTPAGDDFLVGAMLYAWLAHPEPESFCRLVLEAAAPRTTTLSAALLRASARGECSAAWHILLEALQGKTEGTLPRALTGVLAHGHTSGADALAGFLWLQNW